MNRRLREALSPLRGGALAGAVLVLAFSTSGCETLLGESESADPGAGHPGATMPDRGTEAGRQEIAAYLNFLAVLDGTDEQGWHTILEHTREGYANAPSRDRRMRLALVMSRAERISGDSGQTQTWLVEARKLFEETLQETETAPALVRRFAQLQVNELDRRLALYDELSSLRSQLAKAHQESQSAQRDRTQAVARLRGIEAELAEANAKLDAVLKIERNIGPTGKETFP